MSTPSTVSTLPDRTAIEAGVLRLLAEREPEPLAPRALARQLGYDDGRIYGRLRDVLDEMEAEGLVLRRKGRYLHAPRRPKPAAAPEPDPTARQQAEERAAGDENKVVGVLSVNPQGFGFVEVEDREEDVFVRSDNMKTALDGDLVLVRMGKPPRGDRRREGRVLEVVERRRVQTVGTLKVLGHFGFVKPDNQRLTRDIYVPKEAFGGAEEGDKVVASIDRFDPKRDSPEGRVLRVIGPSRDPKTRVLALALSMDVKAGFPEEVEQVAADIPTEIPEHEIARRRDLRGEMIFTIDPFDAKDFDDAVHLKELPGGTYELGVHIADVSAYVDPGTALDQEAYSRATSVYLVDRTISMLPEKLSNKVCSLRPDEDKLAFSCIMEVTPQGAVKDYEIIETVIRSKRRLTYDEAQGFIDGGYADDPVAAHVVRAARLSRTLTKKRMREGSVDFNTPEIKVLLDEEGVPTDIVHKKRKRANRLIEEFMLLANQTVARHIGASGQRGKSGRNGDGQKAKPFVYRIHDKPDAERIQQLAEYVRLFGYELELEDGNATSTSLNKLIQAVQGSPEDPVIERAALRAMSKAVYATENIGHYGLGFTHYSHFTSPIRRYPDLIAHRLLKRYAAGGRAADRERLDTELEHCSKRERTAVDAERESVKLKQVEYAQEHVGETFDGVVTGVTNFGVFVELSALLVEGLVHVREMDDDYYEYDESTFALVGERSGTRYQVGNPVEVQLAGVDVDKREIDLLFA